MMQDLSTMVWKEWKEFLGQGGGRRSGPMRLLFIALVGVLFAARTPSFGSSWITVPVIAYICNIVALSVVPDSFAGERERHTLETLLASRLSDRSILLGKYIAAVLYSVLMGGAVLLLGVATAAAMAKGAMHVRPLIIGCALGAGVLVAAFMTGLGVLISLRAETVRQAQQYVSYTFLILVFAPILGRRLIPEETRGDITRWVTGLGLTKAALVVAGVFLAIDLVLLALAAARFQRSKLVTA